MVRCVVPCLLCLALTLSACGGGGGKKSRIVTGAPVFLSTPILWIDNDDDSTTNGGDVLVFSFDRPVAAGANAPALDLVLGGGMGEVLVGATWTNGFEGDATKMTLTLVPADIVLAGKALGGTTFNVSGANTLTNPGDGTVGATPAAAPTTTVGRIRDTGQNLGGVLGFAIQMVDLDGDGDRDVILGTTGVNLLFLNTGVNSGVFGAGPAIGGEMVADTRGLGVGLINSDALPDFVAANSGLLKANRVYLQTAPGAFATTNTLHRALLGAEDSNGVVVAQGSAPPTWDGQPGGELFVANTGVNMVYYANAAGEFNGDGLLAGVPPPQAVGGASDTRAVALGDLDMDGVEDVVTVDDNGAAPGTITRHLVAPGAGTQATFTPLVLGGALVSPRAVVLCDVDNDTDLDVVVGYAAGGGMQVFFQDGVGAGTFGLPSTTLGGDVRALACTDVDGDGLDDVVQGRGSGQGIAVLLNCGNGIFVDAGVSLPGTVHALAQSGSQTPPALPFAGFDGGGAGDFVSAESGGLNRVFVSAK